MRTLKIEISPIGDNKKEQIERLKQIAGDVWKSANIMITSQFMSEKFMEKSKDLVTFDLNVKYKRIGELSKIKKDQTLKDELAVLKDSKKQDFKERMKIIDDDFKSKFGVLKDSLSERDVKMEFDNVPPNVTNTLKNNIKANWNNDLWDIKCGNKTIRNYKKGMPIPISAKSMEFHTDGKDGYSFDWKVCKGELIKFDIILGKDSSNYKSTLHKIINNTLKYSISSIQYKKNKFFLNLCVNDVIKAVGLNPDIVVGVDLGITTPAYAATNQEHNPYRALGDKNDFLKVRMAIQRRKRKAQRNTVMSTGGHGRKRKMKAADLHTATERNFVKTYNHKISKEIIKFALQENAGVIKLEFLKGFGEEDTKKFVLRNWSYFELQQHIKYKAEHLGITVKFVDPYHTSQTCSTCGNCERGQRDRKKNLFTCKACGLKMNPDRNAAINIANSEYYVKTIDDCEIKKQKDTRIEIFKILKGTSESHIKPINGMVNVNELIALTEIKRRLECRNNHLINVINKTKQLNFTEDNSMVFKL